MDPAAGEVATLRRAGTGRDGVAGPGFGRLRLVPRQFITASKHARIGLQNRSMVEDAMLSLV
jgi:hypothetical protein